MVLPPSNISPEQGSLDALPSPLLIKPGRLFDEFLDCRFGQSQDGRAEAVTQKTKAPFDLADKRFVRVLFETQRGPQRTTQRDRTFLLEAKGKICKKHSPAERRGRTMSINSDTALSRRGEILYAAAGTDAAVMMSIEAGRYYGLNAAAARIWELLESPKTIAELSAVLCEEFEIEAPTCEADVLKFVNDLIANGIVHEAAA